MRYWENAPFYSITVKGLWRDNFDRKLNNLAVTAQETGRQETGDEFWRAKSADKLCSCRFRSLVSCFLVS